jgi:hypothetical protein
MIRLKAFGEVEHDYLINLAQVAYMKPHHLHADVTVIYFAIGNENGLKYVYVQGTLDAIEQQVKEAGVASTIEF